MQMLNVSEVLVKLEVWNHLSKSCKKSKPTRKIVWNAYFAMQKMIISVDSSIAGLQKSKWL